MLTRVYRCDGRLLSADLVNEEATLLYTLEPKIPHGLLNPWILRVTEIVEHHNGALFEGGTPRLYLAYGVFPVV